MATAVAKVNKIKAPKTPPKEFAVKKSYGEIQLLKDGKRIFSAYVNGLSCCAFNEVNGFTFNDADKIKHSKKLQEAFQEYVSACNSQEGGSYQTFILNRKLGEEKAYQPAWFAECLENYPGAYALPWTVNYTHDPANSEVKAYFLPTLNPERLNREQNDDDEEYDWDLILQPSNLP